MGNQEGEANGSRVRNSYREDVALRGGCLWHTDSEEERMKVGMILAGIKE